MDSTTYARRVQADLGWTDATLLSVCLDYISNHAGNTGFKVYLDERRADEQPQKPEWLQDDKFTLTEDQTDEGDDGERITPAGSVWVVQSGPDEEGDYEAICRETGGWLYFPACLLADAQKCTRVEGA